MDPIVELQSGNIRGIVVNHEDGFDYYAFKGIPYAEPPIGDLRFKDPIPKKSWPNVLDCKNYGPICLQNDILFGRESVSEDCLHLSVFTRSIDKKSQNLPVIFVIHGGVFLVDSSDDFIHGPEYLIRKNVVLIFVNYRLGVLGFLNLEDKVVPGNQGLKDQLLALQWVQQNIRQFGGDPNNVTVLGCSAGGICAQYLALSPLSKDLMHKIICQSGVMGNLWAKIKNPKSNAIKLCSLLGKNLIDSTEILQFLKQVDAESLQKAQERLRQIMAIDFQRFPFGPGIDDKSLNPIMPIDPEIAVDNGVQLPFLAGYNSQEAIIALKDEMSFPGITRKEFYERANIDLDWFFPYNSSDTLYRYNLDKAQFKRMYLGNDKLSTENLDKFVRFMNDLIVLESTHRFARIQVEQSSAATYLYVFSYDSPKSFSKFMMKDTPPGVAHFDELPFLFKPHVYEELGIDYLKKGTMDYKIMEQLTEMWYNFAAYGRPTIETSELIPVHWTPVSDGTVIRYLNIDEDITMQSTVSVEQKFIAMKN